MSKEGSRRRTTYDNRSFYTENLTLILPKVEANISEGIASRLSPSELQNEFNKVISQIENLKSQKEYLEKDNKRLTNELVSTHRILVSLLEELHKVNGQNITLLALLNIPTPLDITIDTTCFNYPNPSHQQRLNEELVRSKAESKDMER
jgi:hypothetical protein